MSSSSGRLEGRLCPKCGAYWQCGCRFEELTLPESASCAHDWAEAVGVEIDAALELEQAKVLVCRYCGLYAVEERV
jgi:hypothetical protein